MISDNIGLPAEWTDIATGAAYTLTGLSNLHATDREKWPVMAHYTGADGCRWTRTLASFLGAMRAGRADVRHDYIAGLTFTVDTDAWRKSVGEWEAETSAGLVEPEEAPVSTSAHEWENERWVRQEGRGVWYGPGNWVIYSDFDDSFGLRYLLRPYGDGETIKVFDTPQDAAEHGESIIAAPVSAPAVPEPDVAEATAGLPEGWREVVTGTSWARGSGRVSVVDSADGSGIPFDVYVDGDMMDSFSSLEIAIWHADKAYPVADYR